MIDALTFLLLFTFFVPAVGRGIIDLFGDSQQFSELESLILGFSLGSLLLVKLYTVLGIFHGLTYSPLMLSTLAFCLTGLGFEIRRRQYTPKHLVEGMNRVVEKVRLLPTYYLLLFLFIVLLVFLIDLNPPRHADVLRYHLAYHKVITASGALPFLPHWDLMLATDAELMFSAISTMFGVQFSKLYVGVNYLFAIIASYAYVTRISGVSARYYFVVFLLSPILFLATTVVKPDVLQLVFFINVLILLDTIQRGCYRLSPILLGLFLGQMIALKWTGFIPALAASLYLFYLTMLKKIPWPVLFRIAVIIFLCTILVPAYWYARNYNATGNPIWPQFNTLLYSDDGSLLYEIASKGSSRKGAFASYGVFGYLLYTFFWYKPSVLGGIGLSNFVLILFGAIAKPSTLTRNLLVFLLIYVTLWLFALASFRHLIWLLPIVAVLSSMSISVLMERKGKFVYAVRLLAAGLLAIQLAFIFAYSFMHISYRFGGQSEEEYFATTPNYAAFKAVENAIEDDAVVLTLIPGSEQYYFSQPQIDGNAGSSALIDYYRFNTVETLTRELASLEVKYILYDEELLEQDRYRTLREVISLTTGSIEGYNSKIVRNRLTGAFEERRLFLAKLRDP